MSDSFATPWTAAHQTPLSTGFSRQEYWNGLPFPPLGDLPDPGIEPESPALAGRFFTTVPPGNPLEKHPWWFSSKESIWNAGDLGLIPGLGRSPGGGRSNSLLYSCLENPHGQRRLADYSP